MHTLSVILLACGLSGLAFMGADLPFASLTFVLAAGVALVGLPHGGMDQKIGLRLFSKFSRPVAIVSFLGLYLAIAAVVILGWFVSPVFTVISFFALAAGHFGFEEEARRNLSSVNYGGIIARGGMVIWVPACFQTEATTQLLGLILPGGELLTAAQIILAVQFASPILAVLLMLDVFSILRAELFSKVPIVRDELTRYVPLRVIVFGTLFAVSHPLVSFGVYFCAWHSILGLRHLRSEYQFSNRELIANLLPLSLAAIGLFIVGFLFSASVNNVGPAVAQTIFIGLSAVAVPHLVLHLVFDCRKPVSGAIS